MKICFQKSQLNFLKPHPKGENITPYYIILGVVGMWKIRLVDSTIKEKLTKKNSQEEENEIKRKLNETNQSNND